MRRGCRVRSARSPGSPAGSPFRHNRALHDEVCSRGFDPELGSFVRSYGSRNLDASLLLLPTVGFLPPSDPGVRGTIDAIERNLLVDGLVRRYDTAESKDGLPSDEGVFLACSFWLVDAYVLLDRKDDARRLFERLLAICNDVDLPSEEYDPEPAICWAIFRRRCLISRWSIPPST